MIATFLQAPCWRVIATRSSSQDLFQGLSEFGEWEALVEIDSLTNARTHPAIGHLARMPREDRAYGPGSTYIMAPFAYRAPGRFGDGSFGVLYAALDEQTAMTEVAWHRARFLRTTANRRESAPQQVLTLSLTADVEDLRGQAHAHPEWYGEDPLTYGPAQTLATGLRSGGRSGVAYDSVRHRGGECVAGFRPSIFSGCRHARVVHFFWDGRMLYGPDGLCC